MKPYKVLLPLVLALALMCGCSDDDDDNDITPSPSGSTDTTLTFLTFNMGTGFDVDTLIAQGLADTSVAYFQANTIYQQFLANIPRQRIAALADSIVRMSPDVVGLQEVLVLTNINNGQTTDFSAILLHYIDSLGGPAYTAVTQTVNPFSFSARNAAGTDSINVSYSEGNVILYKTGVLTLLDRDSVIYTASRPGGSFLGAAMTVRQGAQFAKFRTVKQSLVEVFNTRLANSADSTTGNQQAAEFVTFINANADAGVAQIITADLEQGPTGYRLTLLKSNGFTDTFAAVDSTAPGYTCCFGINNTSLTLSERVDYVLAKNHLAVTASAVRLNGILSLTGSNYRLSEHAGVASSVKFD